MRIEKPGVRGPGAAALSHETARAKSRAPCHQHPGGWESLPCKAELVSGFTGWLAMVAELKRGGGGWTRHRQSAGNLSQAPFILLADAPSLAAACRSPGKAAKKTPTPQEQDLGFQLHCPCSENLCGSVRCPAPGRTATQWKADQRETAGL